MGVLDHSTGPKWLPLIIATNKVRQEIAFVSRYPDEAIPLCMVFTHLLADTGQHLSSYPNTLRVTGNPGATRVHEFFRSYDYQDSRQRVMCLLGF